MKIKIKEFKELITKATLNHEVDFIQLNITEDRIKSNLINGDKNAIITLDIENDIFVDYVGEHEYNFNEPRINIIPFLDLFETEEALVKTKVQNSKDSMIKLSANETKVNIFLSQENNERIFRKTLPKTALDFFISFNIDEEFQNKFNKVRKIASSFGKIYFTVDNNTLFLEASDKTNMYSNSIKTDICEVKKDNLYMMFNYQIFANLMKVLSPEKNYKMNFTYYDDKGIGLIYIVSDTKDEQYYLFSKSE